MAIMQNYDKIQLSLGHFTVQIEHTFSFFAMLHLSFPLKHTLNPQRKALKTDFSFGIWPKKFLAISRSTVFFLHTI